ncbi:MAG: nucleotidyltransferase family protein [Verrucomicrobiota bacterium]
MTAEPTDDALLPPEGRLLLLAAQAYPDAGAAARLARTISEGVDWDRFLTTAHAHGVHPLAARTLLACAANLVPAREQQVLRGWLHRTLARNLQLLRGLEAMLNLFQAAGIPVVCLKGPGLAITGYGGLDARASNDLDLLVPPGQLGQATATLLAAGFTRPYPHLTPEEADYFLLDFGYHQSFFRQRDRLTVELHWSLGHEDLGVAEVAESFWSRCHKAEAEGVSLPVMSPVETLLFQARHAAAHGWNVLRHLCDFHAAARRLAPDDWARVAAEARRTQQTAALGVSVLLVREYFGEAIPGPVGSLMGTDRHIHRLARLATRGLRDNLRRGTFHAPSFALPWLLQPGIVAWLRRLQSLSHPCIHERNWIRLPRPLWPLYYVLRPLRLAIKYGRRIG